MRCTLTKLVLTMSMIAANHASAQQQDDPLSRYKMTVAVNEVTLTFHAADAQGLAVNDLRADEVHLLDNGKPPAKLLAFTAMKDVPIRAGFLMDTSGSMAQRFPADRAIALQYAQHLLRAGTDQAFVMDFGYGSGLAQSWTSGPRQLVSGIQTLARGSESPRGGTALYDTLYRACFSMFGKIDNAATGNFILLFSDGGDNMSHISRDVAVSACQRTNTAIYAVRNKHEASTEVLTEMAEETGGRVLFGGGTDAEINADLRRIEAEMRSQYRMVYRPQELKHDGKPHTLELTGPDRAPLIVTRSSYFAPAR